MSLRYYRKLGNSPVPLSNGQSAQFTSVDGGLTAFMATDITNLHAEFERCMIEQRSAISEITAEEFTRDYIDKKKGAPTFKPPWRDELTNGRVRVSEPEFLRRAQSVVGVDNSDLVKKVPAPVAALAETQAVVNKEIATALAPKQDYKPVVGKRKQAAKPS